MARGDCYEAHGRAVALGAESLPEGAVLVHGRPRLQRPPFVRYGHAWIEYPHPEIRGLVIVLDLSNDRRVELPATFYFAAGEIDESDPECECFRYGAEHARALIVKHGHWGPWEGIEASPAAYREDDEGPR